MLSKTTKVIVLLLILFFVFGVILLIYYFNPFVQKLSLKSSTSKIKVLNIDQQFLTDVVYKYNVFSKDGIVVGDYEGLNTGKREKGTITSLQITLTDKPQVYGFFVKDLGNPPLTAFNFKKKGTRGFLEVYIDVGQARAISQDEFSALLTYNINNYLYILTSSRGEISFKDYNPVKQKNWDDSRNGKKIAYIEFK